MTGQSKGWGGAREGAGRKPKGEVAGVSHRPREALAPRFPVHVTVGLREGLPSCRTKTASAALRAAFAAGCDRFGLRLAHYSVQGNRLHFIVEAKDRSALARGMQGLLIRVAKALNRVWDRKGTVFADRYQHRVLRTPAEVRDALSCMLGKASQGREGIDRPVAKARTSLLKEGWRRRGRIPPSP